MLNPAFWRSAFERALKTLAQALIAAIGTDAVGLLHLDWPALFGLAGTAAVLSLLTSIVSAPFGPSAESGTPSLVNTQESPRA